MLFGASGRFSNNSVEFYNHRGMFAGAITLGNTIHYPGNQSRSTFGPNFYLYSEGHTLGTHEKPHTTQGEILGPLYLPAHAIGGTISLITTGTWHGNNFMESGPMSNPPSAW